MRKTSALAPLRREAILKPLHESLMFDSSQCLDLLPFRPGKVAGVFFKPLQIHHDERGSLCELFRQDEMPADLQPAMAYLSQTLPGAARGPHEHLQQTDSFCFFPSPLTPLSEGEGKGLRAVWHLYLWDNRPESPTYLCHEVAILEEPMAVVIPPGVVHAYRNVGKCVGLVVNCPNRLYRGEGRRDPVDEIRHEDDPRSVFRV